MLPIFDHWELNWSTRNGFEDATTREMRALNYSCSPRFKPPFPSQERHLDQAMGEDRDGGGCDKIHWKDVQKSLAEGVDEKLLPQIDTVRKNADRGHATGLKDLS